MSPRSTHTSFRKGKRVFITFRDGTTAIDKFVDRTRDCVEFEELGKVKINTIRSIGIYKDRNHEQNK